MKESRSYNIYLTETLHCKPRYTLMECIVKSVPTSGDIYF